MYDWSIVEPQGPVVRRPVSVVVERMYDWSGFTDEEIETLKSFSCCWKDVRLKPDSAAPIEIRALVSVVVERMYDWSDNAAAPIFNVSVFQLLLKGCTIEAARAVGEISLTPVSVVVERMYDWSWTESKRFGAVCSSFSCCWKDVRLKRRLLLSTRRLTVSVVVERMYDWSRMPEIGTEPRRCFSCCWKDVRLKPANGFRHWERTFQLLLKGCTIEASNDARLWT